MLLGLSCQSCWRKTPRHFFGTSGILKHFLTRGFPVFLRTTLLCLASQSCIGGTFWVNWASMLSLKPFLPILQVGRFRHTWNWHKFPENVFCSAKSCTPLACSILFCYVSTTKTGVYEKVNHHLHPNHLALLYHHSPFQ